MLEALGPITMAIGSEWKAMFEGLKRDMYRRILINHNQAPAALAEQRARTEPLE